MPFNIAIVGCGGVSEMHFPAYARHPERARVVAACDPDLDRARAAAEKWNIPVTFSTPEEMIEGAAWEVAVVCTPTPVREAVVRTVAAAGRHLYVEKPMSDSLAEAERMVAVCRQAGVRLA